MSTFPRATRHSQAYYAAIIEVLLTGLTRNYKHAALAAMLNERAIPAPTGEPWTTQGITSALKKLRKRAGPIWGAALELVFDGRKTASECRPLLQSL